MRPLTEQELETLAHLSEHPGWKILKRIAVERRDDEFDRFARTLIGQGAKALNAETIEYTRGFHRGTTYLINQVDSAFRSYAEGYNDPKENNV